jgi:hypothetical protein
MKLAPRANTSDANRPSLTMKKTSDWTAIW